MHRSCRRAVWRRPHLSPSGLAPGELKHTDDEEFPLWVPPPHHYSITHLVVADADAPDGDGDMGMGGKRKAEAGPGRHARARRNRPIVRPSSPG
eukprot:scaffold2957_cov226-Isochrysis_galbana.AAC.7